MKDNYIGIVVLVTVVAAVCQLSNRICRCRLQYLLQCTIILIFYLKKSHVLSAVGNYVLQVYSNYPIHAHTINIIIMYCSYSRQQVIAKYMYIIVKWEITRKFHFVFARYIRHTAHTLTSYMTHLRIHLWVQVHFAFGRVNS